MIYAFQHKLIKMIRKPKSDSFISVSLYETGAGFRVDYEQQGKTRRGETVKDYNLASFMFDTKLQDLEGQ